MASGQKTLNMGRFRKDRKLYKLVDIHGKGELLDWLRYAMKTGDNSFLDGYIDTKVSDLMYNQGKGKVCTITELVTIRNKERNEELSAFLRKKGKGKSGPNVLDEFNQEGENVGDLRKALKLLDGGGKVGKGDSKYRDVVWKINERGAMGETIIGVCLLQSSDIHNRLALKILDAYPKLVNDIHVSEDYYGFTPLHQAIVNQDTAMVFTLLKRGADVNIRCFGAYFCAEDQKSGRNDSLEYEHVDIPLKTNYIGKMYFGEYPLSFAACMDQPDAYRLLLRKKANPHAQDSNGNTVLHMCVIHQQMRMFRIALENGASLKILNKQKLTPLTLASKMGNQKMFNFILELEGTRLWSYGDASSTTYPLAKIDSIDETTGELNGNSALSLAVYGQTSGHLDLLEGFLDKLIMEKWKTFGKRRFFFSLFVYIVHCICIALSFYFRPYSYSTEAHTDGAITRHGKPAADLTEIIPKDDLYNIKGTKAPYNISMSQCHLRNYVDKDNPVPWMNSYGRIYVDCLVVFSVSVQVFLDIQDIRHIGWKKWCSILSAFPAKVAYKFSFLGIVLTMPVRAACSVNPYLLVFDNVLAIITVLLTSVHFLFYCRAFFFVGPFVLMIYTIIATDIKRFMTIYIIFLIGFSQAFLLVFLTCEREASVLNNFSRTPDNKTMSFTEFKSSPDVPQELKEKYKTQLFYNKAVKFNNLIVSPVEAVIRTFIMTSGEFSTMYKNLVFCPAEKMIWFLFMVFELGVYILLFNMLIAMMARTYDTISKTKKEYKRQFARVILMLEVSLSPKQRLEHLLSYSRPTATIKKTRCFVVNKKQFQGFSSEEEVLIAQRDKESRQAEERRMLFKRKLRDAEQREGRPFSQRGSTARSSGSWW